MCFSLLVLYPAVAIKNTMALFETLALKKYRTDLCFDSPGCSAAPRGLGVVVKRFCCSFLRNVTGHQSPRKMSMTLGLSGTVRNV